MEKEIDLNLEQYMEKPKEVVATTTPVKPRVHISDNACVACEG